jgi:hypothetical protein
MLINEVILEDQNDILNDIEEYIVRAKARGFTKISTPTLLAKIRSSGYSIDNTSFMNLIRTISSVGSVNKAEIKLDSAISTTPQNKDDNTVSNMAAKQIKKGMK